MATLVCGRLPTPCLSHPRWWLRDWRPFETVCALLAAALLFAGLTPLAPDDAEHDKEYEVKAAFIFNFAKYVDWPPSAFERSDSPIVLGIVGTDPFGAIIDRAVAGKNVSGHPFVVKRLRWGADLKDCELLFVSSSEKDKVSQLRSILKTEPVLAIGDTAGFASHGGIIGFFNEQGRIRFEINSEAAKRAHLTVSSKLLALARIVSDAK